jgi:hypothetical protein
MRKRRPAGYVETWDGGYVRRDAKGRQTFVICKMIKGRVFKVSTRTHTISAALEEWKRFQADPRGYVPGGSEHKEPIYLDEKLAEDFLTHSRDVDRNSKPWVRKQKGYLAWWAEELGGVDLRRANLAHDILAALKKTKDARNHRIAVLKRLYSYLRTVRHVLSAAEDPTFGTLRVPQSSPEQWKREKAIPKEHYLLAREHLAPHWRNPMDIQAGTGWHTTELRRFAQSGQVERYPKRGGAEGVAGVLVCPQTKGGEMLRTAVSEEVQEAAKRLRERGSLSAEKYGLAVKAACKAAGIPVFTPGRFRHSVATWAINNGADPATVAAFLNHKSPRTTRRFYATHAVPTKIPTLL